MDYERGASLVEQVAHDLDMQNEQALLTSWVERLPREILEKHPWLCVYRAWGYYWTGRREMEEEWLQSGRKISSTRYSRKDLGKEPHPGAHRGDTRCTLRLLLKIFPGTGNGRKSPAPAPGERRDAF